MTEKEQKFLDSVIRCYCEPNPRGSRTLTVMEAAYSAAIRQGINVPAGDAERDAFFYTFMGGLMTRPEAAAYMDAGITAERERREQLREERRRQALAARAQAQEQLRVIFAAAQEIQRLTSGMIYQRNSREMDSLRDVERRIASIGAVI